MQTVWTCVFQYCLVKVLLAVVICITQSQGVFCELSTSTKAAAIWVRRQFSPFFYFGCFQRSVYVDARIDQTHPSPLPNDCHVCVVDVLSPIPNQIEEARPWIEVCCDQDSGVFGFCSNGFFLPFYFVYTLHPT